MPTEDAGESDCPVDMKKTGNEAQVEKGDQ